MKKLLSLVLALLLTVGLVPVVTSPALATDGLNWIVPLSEGYERIGEFSEGMACVIKDGKLGFIDKKGNLVVPLEYDGTFIDEYSYKRYYWSYFEDGLACVFKDGKYGFVNKSGKVVIPLEYDPRDGHGYGSYFNDGLAVVGKKDGSGTFNYGVINKTGKVVIPFEYQSIERYNGIGLFAAWKEGSNVYFDKSGNKFSLPNGFSLAVDDYYYNSDLRLVVKYESKTIWGFIDKTGKLVLTLDRDYTSVTGFFNGYAIIQKDGKYGLINRSGVEVVPPQYDRIGSDNNHQARTNEGMVWVANGDSINGYLGTYYNMATKQPISDLKYEDDDYWSVFFSDGMGKIYKDGKFGFIDKTGKEVIAPQYDGVEPFRNGISSFDKDGKTGLIDKSGNIIFEKEGWDIWYYNGAVFAWNENGEMGLLDTKGNVIIPLEYDDVYPLWEEDVITGEIWGERGMIGIENNGALGVVKLSGFAGADNSNPAEGIDYDSEDIIVIGNGTETSINLTKETITLGDYKPAAFSTDGGSKWKPVKDALGAAKFPKLLNKDMTLHLSDKPIDKSTKQPAEGATIVTFAAIEKRATAPKLTVNYEIAADKTGTTAGEWVLSEKGGTEAVKKDILVGVASGKNVDANGFGQFSANGGIAVQGAKKTTYFIKIGPAESGGKYTAASKVKKVSAAGQTKAPTYKVSTKAEKKDKDGTVKTPASAIIKVKANTYVSISGGAPTLYSAKEDLDVLEVKGTIELWMAGTAKKPASVKQTITR